MKIPHFLFCLCFLILSLCGPSSSETNRSLALVGAKIYPSPTEKPIIDGVTLIREGQIIAVGEKGKLKIPPSTPTLDCTGLTLLASFCNSHVHLTEPKWENATAIPSARLSRELREMFTKYGFTIVLDTGSFLENTRAIRQRIATGEVDGPVILTAGIPIAPKDGTPIYVKPIKLPEIETSEHAIAMVRERVKQGADVIKIFAGSWVGEGKTVAMPLELVRAVTTEAHRHGKCVVAHPQNDAGLNAAVDGGVDVLLHTAPETGRWGPSLIGRMKQAKIALVPTLKLWRVELEKGGAPPKAVQQFQHAGTEQLRAYVEAGGQILFGTDVGYLTDYDPTEEYLLMARAGMSFQQILASLTVAPAERFGISKQRGRVAPGMDADLVLLSRDPAVEIRALSSIRYTLRKGRIIYDSQATH